MDNKYSGTIVNIELKNGGIGFEKYLVTLKQKHDVLCFIEFRSIKSMKALSNFKIGSRVDVIAWTEGTISKNSGQHFNNIIAKKITESMVND